MFLAKQIQKDDYKIGYVSSASVFHIHSETWVQVKRRYERESIALQQIMPEIHVSFMDLVKLVLAGVFSDIAVAIRKKSGLAETPGVVAFRACQYWGGYKGNHLHRQLSQEAKRKYFYPNEAVSQRLFMSDR